MTAHHPGEYPVRDSDRPMKPTIMNVDKSGISMSWKTAASVVAVIVLGALGWSAFANSLARSADLRAHNENPEAHKNHVIPRAEVEAMVGPLKKKVDQTALTVISVQNGFYDSRAEDLAYRAVEKMPSRTPSRKRIERFEEVRRQAKANLRGGKDIRDGIDGLTF